MTARKVFLLIASGLFTCGGLSAYINDAWSCSPKPYVVSQNGSDAVASNHRPAISKANITQLTQLAAAEDRKEGRVQVLFSSDSHSLIAEGGSYGFDDDPCHNFWAWDLTGPGDHFSIYNEESRRVMIEEAVPGSKSLLLFTAGFNNFDPRYSLWMPDGRTVELGQADAVRVVQFPAKSLLVLQRPDVDQPEFRDPDDGVVIQNPAGPLAQAVLFSPDHQVFVTVNSGHLSMWRTQDQVKIADLFPDPQADRSGSGGSNPDYSMAFSEDGSLFAYGFGRLVTVWDVRTQQAVKTLSEEFVAFSPDGKDLVTRTGIWRHETAEADWKPIGQFAHALTKTNYFAGFSPDSTLYATVEYGSVPPIGTPSPWMRDTPVRKFQFHDAVSGELVTEHSFEADVFDFAWSPDGKLVAALVGASKQQHEYDVTGTVYVWGIPVQ